MGCVVGYLFFIYLCYCVLGYLLCIRILIYIKNNKDSINDTVFLKTEFLSIGIIGIILIPIHIIFTFLPFNYVYPVSAFSLILFGICCFTVSIVTPVIITLKNEKKFFYF